MMLSKNHNKINMSFFRNHHMSFIKPYFLLLITMVLAGCVDLSGTRLTPEKKSIHQASDSSKIRLQKKKSASLNGEVHTMRGGLGIFSIGMNQLRTSVQEQYHVPASSTMWYNAGNESHSIVEYWYQHKLKRPVILIGHSLGANEQIKVARNLDKAGIPVALLITVDAVSQTIVPANVKHALNIYKPGFVPMFSGLKLRAVNPSATQIDNINVNTLKNVKVNHFTIDKDKIVQAMILAEVEKVLSNANRKET